MDLTIEDINVLLEALPAWENYEQLADGMVDVAMAMVGPRDPVERKRWQDDQAVETAQRKEKGKADAIIKKERSVILQAKLLTLRGQLEGAEFAAEARGVK